MRSPGISDPSDPYKEIKEIHSELNELLSAYESDIARYTMDHDEVGVSSLQEKENRINDLLYKLALLVEEIAKARSSNHVTISRHKAQLADYTTSFSLFRRKLEEARKREQLFSSAYTEHSSELDDLIGERASLRSSTKVADTALETAVGTKESLGRQRGSIKDTTGNLSSIDGTMNNVSSIARRIRWRSFYNDLCLGFVIALCLFILILFILKKLYIL